MAASPNFAHQALAGLNGISSPATEAGEATRDLRSLLWCSIDNGDSCDLDQFSVAEALPAGAAKVMIAIAELGAIVETQSALNEPSLRATASAYSAAATVPVTREQCSTDANVLNPGADRLAIVIEMVFEGDGSLRSSDLYGARVRNHAKLAYSSVGGWLEGNGPMPHVIGAVDGLNGNLRFQDRVALRLKTRRHQLCELGSETGEIHSAFAGGLPKDMDVENKNRAKDIIEDFMIAANGAAVRYLEAKQVPLAVARRSTGFANR